MPKTRIMGVLAYLPTGGEVAFLVRNLGGYRHRGPLAAAHLAQRMCESAGFYERPGDYPLHEDARVALAAARTFLLLLDVDANFPMECPNNCAWIVPNA